MENVFFNGYVMDDVTMLEEALTKEYDLNELKSFFESVNVNEGIGLNFYTSKLTFSEVNNIFPIEIIRSGEYSVYKVIQGGYFYVFWIKPFVSDTNNFSYEPSVYFTAYIPSDTSISQFNTLILGVSTAEDVKRIDPNFELSFLVSSGIFSYSYIDDETLMEIEYSNQGNLKEYKNLIIKEKKIISRSLAPSRYSTILSNDLP